MIEIKEIISLGENENQLFIESSNDKLKLAKQINAILNSNGGSIYIGINSKKKIVGVYPQHELEEFKIISALYFQKDFKFNFEIIEIENKLLLKLIIFESISKPIYLKNDQNKEVYLNQKGEVVKASSLIVKMLKFQSENNEIPNQFSNDETQLLELIRLKSPISLNLIYKSTSIPKKTVDYILVRLLNWKQIHFKLNDGTCYFKC